MERRTFVGSLTAALGLPFLQREVSTTSGGEGPHSTPSTSTGCDSYSVRPIENGMFIAETMYNGYPASAIGHNPELAALNLKNFLAICRRDGHDASMAHGLADSGQLAASAADREESKRFTLEWARRSNQLDRVTSFKD